MSRSSRKLVPKSVFSRDAGGGGSIPGPGSTTPTGRKRSASLGQDRQAFFKILGALYKSQKKLERESSQVGLWSSLILYFTQEHLHTYSCTVTTGVQCRHLSSPNIPNHFQL